MMASSSNLPPPSQHHHPHPSYQQHHPPPSYPPSTRTSSSSTAYHHHHHHHHSPPHSSPLDSRPPSHSYPPASHPPPPPPQQQQQHHSQYQSSGPAPPPPISTSHAPPYHGAPHTAPPGAAPPIPRVNESPNARSQHPLREGESHSYHPHSRSDHATPVSVNRSSSVDYSHQRTPNTPPPTASYPPGAEGTAPPHSASMDHGHHYGPPPPHSNGVHHPGQPHYAPAPQPPPGPPHHEQPYMTPVMESHPGSYAMYGPGYGAPQGAFMGSNTKRKQMRATQACEQCRQRKQKCDEGNPCSFCKEQNLKCNYRDTPPAKTDKNMERLLNYMENTQNELRGLSSRFESFEKRLSSIETSRRSPQFSGSDHGTVTKYAQPPQPTSSQEAPQDDKLNVVGDHRTAPHKLLSLWKSMSKLLKDANVSQQPDYVMQAEDRGILRLYSRDEGVDDHDGSQTAGSASSPARSEDSAAQTPPYGIWGYGFPSTPASDTRRTDGSNWSGLKPDNTLDLDDNTINLLYDEYMTHIHVMHPFLDRGSLRRAFNDFIHEYGSGGTARFSSTFAVGNDGPERPSKRQRTSISTSQGVSNGEYGVPSDDKIEFKPSNAIVLLVLALGKICSHKEPLGPIVKNNMVTANAYVANRGPFYAGSASSNSPGIKPSPHSPQATPGPAVPTPPIDNMAPPVARSRRPSTDNAFPQGTRNIEIIPGLAYFAKATEIMGAHIDGNDLSHAQMFILAGLYKGQLARVKESMTWYSMAGRVILFLLDRYKLYNHRYYGEVYNRDEVAARMQTNQKRIRDNKRLNLIVFAAWTDIQLESDILAELKFPSSNIQTKEETIMWPQGIDDELNYQSMKSPYLDEIIMVSYNAQFFMRRKLNQIHRELYGEQCLGLSYHEVKAKLEGYVEDMAHFRRTLPAPFAWHDDDPLAEDILGARIRGKYWGTVYLVHRPFLDFALHIRPHLQDSPEKTVRDVARDSYNNYRPDADIHLFEAINQYPEKEITQKAHRCLEAAMASTVAFDGVPDRLIMTNIHGTAHAQFGNILVLASAYRSHMRSAIDGNKLHQLFDRTIRFLRRLSPISQTCAQDAAILEQVHRKLFPLRDEHPNVYRNENVSGIDAGEQRDVSYARPVMAPDAHTSFTSVSSMRSG